MPYASLTTFDSPPNMATRTPEGWIGKFEKDVPTDLIMRGAQHTEPEPKMEKQLVAATQPESPVVIKKGNLFDGENRLILIGALAFIFLILQILFFNREEIFKQPARRRRRR